jgi:hypothetical protein
LGRTQDAAYNSEGESIAATYLAGRFKDIRGIRRFQVVQKSIDFIELRYEKAGSGAEAEAEEIVREIRARLGENMVVRAVEVPALAMTSRGKCLLVIGLQAKTRFIPPQSGDQH